MHANSPDGLSYGDGSPLARAVSIAYRVLRFSRKYNTRFYTGITNSLTDRLAVPSGRADSFQEQAHPDGRGSQADHKTMTTETTPDYETSGHEGTASKDTDTYSVEPERFAKVHVTVGGAMQFVDVEEPSERWITSDHVAEVVR